MTIEAHTGGLRIAAGYFLGNPEVTFVQIPKQ